MESYNDWLAHYGIPGMKWGQVNGPPYPLSRGQMNSQERQKAVGRAYSINEKLRAAQSKKYVKASDLRDAAKYHAEKYEKKANKMEEKGRFDKADKYRMYSEQSKEAAKKYDNLAEEGRKKTLDILKKYKDDPYLEIVSQKRKIFTITKDSALIPGESTSAFIHYALAGPAGILYKALKERTEGVDLYRVKVRNE